MLDGPQGWGRCSSVIGRYDPATSPVLTDRAMSLREWKDIAACIVKGGKSM